MPFTIWVTIAPTCTTPISRIQMETTSEMLVNKGGTSSVNNGWIVPLGRCNTKIEQSVQPIWLYLWGVYVFTCFRTNHTGMQLRRNEQRGNRCSGLCVSVLLLLRKCRFWINVQRWLYRTNPCLRRSSIMAFVEQWFTGLWASVRSRRFVCRILILRITHNDDCDK